jgi:spermidine/putrescine transport system permease protein
VTFFVTGNGFETLAVEIYARARQGISLEINALSGVMFIFALLLVVGYYFIQQAGQNRRAKQKTQARKRGVDQ